MREDPNPQRVWPSCCCSVTKSCMTLHDPWTAACQASLFITISHSLLKLMSTESVMPFNHLILCHPGLLLPLIFLSIRVFSNESALHIRWPKYWSFSFSISSSNEYSGLTSFRIDQFYLLAVQGTLKSLLQYHSLKASVLWCSAFFKENSALGLILCCPYLEICSIFQTQSFCIFIWHKVSQII